MKPVENVFSKNILSQMSFKVHVNLKFIMDSALQKLFKSFENRSKSLYRPNLICRLVQKKVREGVPIITDSSVLRQLPLYWERDSVYIVSYVGT